MTSAYTDWPLLLKRLKALKHTLLPPYPFHYRWKKKLAYTTCCVIYNAVVIHSQLTFREHCKSCVFGVNVFLSSGRSAIFWRLSWTCSKGSDPGYWFPAWLQQARGVGSPAFNNKKTVKSVSDLTLCTNVAIFIYGIYLHISGVSLKVRPSRLVTG